MGLGEVSVGAAGHFRLVRLQGAITIIGAAFAYLLVTPPAAKSFAYGSCIALISTLLLAWRLKRGHQENLEAGRALRQAYRTAIERMAWTIIMLATGFKVLKLLPLWMLAGFVAGQAAWLLLPLWARARLKTGSEKTENVK
jgi:F0F1-type ATP synthase assembly protein I